MILVLIGLALGVIRLVIRCGTVHPTASWDPLQIELLRNLFEEDLRGAVSAAVQPPGSRARILRVSHRDGSESRWEVAGPPHRLHRRRAGVQASLGLVANATFQAATDHVRVTLEEPAGSGAPTVLVLPLRVSPSRRLP